MLTGLKRHTLSLAGVVLAAPFAQAGANDLFAPPVSLVQAQVEEIASGDLDNDGDTDIVAIDGADFGVQFLENTGDGTFIDRGYLDLGGAGLNRFTLADVNGDGLLDVVIAFVFYDEIAIFFNQGGFQFARYQVIDSGGNDPVDIVAADVNNDGINDLLCTHAASDDVTVHIGVGGGFFQLGAPVPTAVSPRGIATGDFNGDGFIDFACASWNEGNVGVHLGDGNGGFSPLLPTGYVGDGPTDLATCDLNQDGLTDLVVVNFADDDVAVLIGDGAGSFTVTQIVDLGNEPARCVVADFDNDQVDDVAISLVDGAGVSLCIGLGNGQLSTPLLFPVSGEPLGITTADFDGDNAPDVATANIISDDITVLFNAEGPFETAPVITEQPTPAVLLPIGGGDVVLAVSATGENLAYQWRRDGVPLTDNGDVMGATSNELSLAVTTEDVGIYDCVVTGNGPLTISAGSVVAVRPSCPGDLNGDQVVNSADLNGLLVAFGDPCD